MLAREGWPWARRGTLKPNSPGVWNGNRRLHRPSLGPNLQDHRQTLTLFNHATKARRNHEQHQDHRHLQCLRGRQYLSANFWACCRDLLNSTALLPAQPRPTSPAGGRPGQHTRHGASGRCPGPRHPPARPGKRVVPVRCALCAACANMLCAGACLISSSACHALHQSQFILIECSIQAYGIRLLWHTPGRG